MFTRLAKLVPSVALAASLVAAPAMAAPYSPTNIAQPSAEASIVLAGFSDRSGAAQLKRLLNPHTHYIAVTRAARAATGNPNIRVIDRRTGDSVFRCSFLTVQGKRALICD